MRTRSCGQQGHGSANIAAVSCARGGTSGEGNPAMGRSEQMSSTHSKRNIPAACHAYKRFRRGNTASRPRPPTRWRVRGVRTPVPLPSRVALRRERAMPLRDKAYCTAESASWRLPICSDAGVRVSAFGLSSTSWSTFRPLA
jgi:hypothetical protein